MLFKSTRPGSQFPFIETPQNYFLQRVQMPRKQFDGLIQGWIKGNQFRHLQDRAEGKRFFSERAHFSTKSNPLLNRTSQFFTAIAKTVHSFFQKWV